MILDGDSFEIKKTIKYFGKKWTVEAFTYDEMKEHLKYEQEEKDGQKQIERLIEKSIYRKFLWKKIKFPVKKLKTDQFLNLQDELYDFVIGKDFMKRAKEGIQKKRE